MKPAGRALLNDESLRDGLQSPSVRDPSIEEKIGILHLMEQVGINMLDIGLPGAGPRAVAHCEALAREIGRARLKIKPNCAARTHENDIRPIAEIVQRTGVPVEAATFIGSSPIRRYTENWTDDFLLRTTEHAVKYAVVARPRRHVRHRGHDALRSRDHPAHVHHGDQLRRQGDRDLRHCGTCDADGRGRADSFRHQRGDQADRGAIFASSGTATAIAAWRLRIRLPPWSPGQKSFTPRRAASANASATRRWTRCWST